MDFTSLVNPIRAVVINERYRRTDSQALNRAYPGHMMSQSNNDIRQWFRPGKCQSADPGLASRGLSESALRGF